LSPLFRRGELKSALLDVLGSVGPANGYVIMQTIADELGDAWHPSPGAVYPALLGLQDAGLIDAYDGDGARFYELSATGRTALLQVAGTLDKVAARARTSPRRDPTLGRMLDEWVATVPRRERRLDEDQQRSVLDALANAQLLIERTNDERGER
jgi:DNA-binding PadR family transcriptional regulator